MRRAIFIVAFLGHLLIFAAVVPVLARTVASRPSPRGGVDRPADFNGDGYTDLAVGSPGADSSAGPGSVSVIYGGPSGLSSAGAQLWSQGSTGIIGTPEDGDLFGWSLAWGDFDGDGHDDLAIGVPWEDMGNVSPFTDEGAVQIIYGSRSGLLAEDDQLWTLDSVGIQGSATGQDDFGWSLARGDFDGDGRDDLAIGSVQWGGSSSGVVHVLYGTGRGLTGGRDQVWTQDSLGIPGVAEQGDRFGSAITSGDFDGDGDDDLAVGAPCESIRNMVGCQGAVNIILGAPDGLTGTGAQLWHQGSPGILGDPESNDFFGHALAAGDFDGDDRDDLAITAVFETFGRIQASFTGAVSVLYGSGQGLTSTDDQVWGQHTPGVQGVPESNEAFGHSLAAGDIDGDGRGDLAIGVPRDGSDESGAVNVLYGSVTGLSAADDDFWTQASAGVPGGPEEDDRFGEAVTVGDFDSDDDLELAVGVPNEDLDGTDVGVVDLLIGTTNGLTGAGSQLWWRGASGIPGPVEPEMEFGKSLAH